MKSKTASTITIDSYFTPFSSVIMYNKSRRGDIIIRVLGITVFVILILVSVAGAAPFAYVTSPGIDTGTVFVIDTETDNLTAVVPVEGWPRDVAVNSTGTNVYVATPGFDPTISVIDTATNTVSATVDVEGYPMQVAVNPAGTKVYVTDRDGTNISVIDTSTNTLMAQINVGMIIRNVVISPDEKKNLCYEPFQQYYFCN